MCLRKKVKIFQSYLRFGCSWCVLMPVYHTWPRLLPIQNWQTWIRNSSWRRLNKLSLQGAHCWNWQVVRSGILQIDAFTLVARYWPRNDYITRALSQHTIRLGARSVVYCLSQSYLSFVKCLSYPLYCPTQCLVYCTARIQHPRLVIVSFFVPSAHI